MSEQVTLDSVEPVADKGRRMLLLAGTGAIGAVGAGFTAWPFLASWQPSAKARVVGAPIEVYIGDLEPGQLIREVWRGQTIGILHRTPTMIENLAEITEYLRDPESEVEAQQPPYANGTARAIKPEYLVFNMHCTHLGCIPEYVPEVGPQPFEQDWKGGFFCPCHKSKFDLAGRVYSGVPAPTNLIIPPYHFVDDEHIVVGAHPQGAA